MVRPRIVPETEPIASSEATPRADDLVQLMNKVDQKGADVSKQKKIDSDRGRFRSRMGRLDSAMRAAKGGKAVQIMRLDLYEPPSLYHPPALLYTRLDGACRSPRFHVLTSI